MAKLVGHRALITGASSGIGAALARSLARRGADVVLTARRAGPLTALAEELRGAHRVATDVIALDLAAADGADELWRRARAAGPITVLANNAGFGQYRRFDAIEPARDAELVALNVAAPVALCHALVADPGAGGRRYILNVASVVAWQAIPHFATYAASKAFVRGFSEALYYELADRDIGVTCLCPGGTRTEFHAQAGAGDYGRLARAAMLDAGPVAEVGVRAMLAGKKTVIPGRLNKLSCFVVGLLPRGLASRSAARVMGPPRDAPLPPRRPPAV
ncbi:MAG: SDR family NAD(P)-dependent oxidoreductase [Kofleriaceae bacterium]